MAMYLQKLRGFLDQDFKGRRYIWAMIWLLFTPGPGGEVENDALFHFERVH